MEDYLDLSDLSDKEDAEQLDLSPLMVNWLDLNIDGEKHKLGICSLPGCKYKKIWRSLSFDIKCLKDSEVKDIFCFCMKGEFHLFRVDNLIKKYTEAGFTVHHHPIEDGQVPPFENLLKILEEIKICLMNNRKSAIHCYGGLGRSCLVAMCLSMYLNESIDIDAIREKIKELRGEGALGSIKQYNYVTDFRETLSAHRKIACEETEDRSASR